LRQDATDDLNVKSLLDPCYCNSHWQSQNLICLGLIMETIRGQWSGWI